MRDRDFNWLCYRQSNGYFINIFAINFTACSNAIVSIAEGFIGASVYPFYSHKPELVVEVSDVVSVRGVGGVGDGGDVILRVGMDAGPA